MRAAINQAEREKCEALGLPYEPPFAVADPPALWPANLLALGIFDEARVMPARAGFGDVAGYDPVVLDRLMRMHRVPARREREVWQKLMAIRPLLWWKPQGSGD